VRQRGIDQLQKVYRAHVTRLSRRHQAYNMNKPIAFGAEQSEKWAQDVHKYVVKYNTKAIFSNLAM